MTKEKQIEEMAETIDIIMQRRCFHNSCVSCEFDYTDTCKANMLATTLINDYDYRKATDVAREIDNALHDMAIEYANAGHPEYFAVCEMVHHKVIAPIEKKYTEVGE